MGHLALNIRTCSDNLCDSAAGRAVDDHLGNRRYFPDADRSLPFVSHGRLAVYVVDDGSSVCDSIKLLLDSEGCQTTTFATSHEFLTFPHPLVPSCLILGLSSSDLDGLQLQRRLASDRPDIPIIFIADHVDVPAAVQAMKNGAVELLTMPISDSVLLNATHAAFDRSVMTLLDHANLQALVYRYTKLSHRERDVMGLIVRGLLNKQVGFELGISEITVKAHRGQVMRKMKADSFAELVNMARRLGLSN